MQRLIYIPFTFLFLFLSITTFSQVQKVKYFVKYNDATCLFDFCIIITEGQAMTMQQRVQMNCQYTVVVPTGSTVSLAAKYMPLQSNQTYTGTIPMEWQLGSLVVAPASKPECDFYSVVPTLAPTSFYNNLSTNDTVPLFALAISPVTDCAKGIRIFDNSTDPGPLDAGMNGSNFSNGFTIGGIQNKYDGNAASRFPSKPEVISLQASCSQGLHLEVEARSAQTTCQQGLSYEWKGPEGFLSDEPVVNMPNAGPLQKGKYYIRVQDSLGCTILDSVQAYVKPDAGKDASVLCFQSGAATLKAKGTGHWELSVDNPGTAVFSDSAQAVTLVSSFSVPGAYKAIWFSETCSDTVDINVGSNCNCPIENTLEIPSVFLFCAETNAMGISGNTVNATGNYQWIYKVNQGAYTNAGGNAEEEDYMIDNMATGTYEFRRVFTRTEPSVCKDTSNAVFFDILPSLSAGEDINLFCFSSDTAEIMASGQGVWTQLSGNPGAVEIIQYGNPIQTFTGFEQPGIYSLTWSNEACVDTINITANPFCGCHEANGGQNREVCAGDTIAIQGTCSVGVWRAATQNPQGGQILGNEAGEAQIYFQSNAMGSYYFLYVVFDTLVDTVRIDVRSKPVINAGEDFDYCQGSQSVLLVAGGGSQYHWSTGENGANIMVSPAQTTTYSVTGTDVHGCRGIDTIIVMVLPKPQGMIPPPPVAVTGTTITIQSGTWSDAASFIWQGPGGFTATQANPVISNITVQHAGTYTLTVFSEFECASSASIVLSVNEGTLPVEIYNLKGYYDEIREGNVVSWEVASLSQHDVFIVEKSIDLIHFEEVETVKSYGKTGLYEILDTDFYSSGLIYYRIVNVDLDNQRQIYGPVKILSKENGGKTFSIFPIPCTDNLVMQSQLLLDEPINIQIMDMKGQIIQRMQYHYSYPVNLLHDFNVSILKPGMYRIWIGYQGSDYIYSFIKVE